MNRQERRRLASTAAPSVLVPGQTGSVRPANVVPKFSPTVVRAHKLRRQGETKQALMLCREILRENPHDAVTFDLAAQIAIEMSQPEEAVKLAEAAITIQPDFIEAQCNLTSAYVNAGRLDDAVRTVDRVIEKRPGYAQAHLNRASALHRLGRTDAAIEAASLAVQLEPKNPTAHYNRGLMLIDAGQMDAGNAEMENALQLDPSNGQAFYTLARGRARDRVAGKVADVQRRLLNRKLDKGNRARFNFALGELLERKGDYAKAFQHYKDGNRLTRDMITYDGAKAVGYMDSLIRNIGPSVFERHGGKGCPSDVPIFILGLPRSGTTLVEQIVASHSAVYGADELPFIGNIFKDMGKGNASLTFAQALEMVGPDWFREAGEHYVAQVRAISPDSPHITDKMPLNFRQIALIKLILPNAKIIHIRKHPLDSVFGCFKVRFALGQEFTYDLDEMADYYLAYERLMSHWHTVLPGEILDVHYENLVEDQETESRRIIEYLGLPWEDACLSFHETKRQVRTASNVQVREKMYSGAVGRWKRYAEQLEPIRLKLQEAIDRYPVKLDG